MQNACQITLPNEQFLFTKLATRTKYILELLGHAVGCLKMRHFSLICARCCPVMQFISATGYSNVNPWCNNRATIFYVGKTREYNLSVHTSVLLWRTVLYCQMGLTAFQRNIAFYSASKLMPDEGALNRETKSDGPNASEHVIYCLITRQ